VAWQWKRLKLDVTPPQIVITHPTKNEPPTRQP
jgi:hypothetical protein